MAIFDFKSLQFWYSLNFIRVILETSRSLWIAGKWYDLRNSSPTNQQTMTLETNGIQCRAQSYLFIYFFHFKCKCITSYIFSRMIFLWFYFFYSGCFHSFSRKRNLIALQRINIWQARRGRMNTICGEWEIERKKSNRKQACREE